MRVHTAGDALPVVVQLVEGWKTHAVLPSLDALILAVAWVCDNRLRESDDLISSIVGLARLACDRNDVLRYTMRGFLSSFNLEGLRI
jgi:hypothetical protein